MITYYLRGLFWVVPRAIYRWIRNEAICDLFHPDQEFIPLTAEEHKARGIPPFYQLTYWGCKTCKRHLGR